MSTPGYTGYPAPQPGGYDAWAQFQAGGQPPGPKPLSKAAVTSLVFGIIGGVLFSVIFGIVGLVATGKNGDRRGRGLAWAGLILSVLWIIAFVGIIVWAVQRQPDRDANGEVNGAGTSQVFDLQVGDCLRDPAVVDGTTVTEAAVVPCSQPHLGQIVADIPLPDTTYSQSAIEAEAEKLCSAEAPSALTSDVPTDAQLFYLIPDQKAWDRDSTHTATCGLSSTTQLTKSYVSGH